MEGFEKFITEWGFMFGVIIFFLQEAIANAKIKSNSLVQLIINVLKFLIGKKEE